MRVNRSMMRMYLSISVILNIIALITLFLPTDRARGLMGDAAWKGLAKYGLTRRPDDPAILTVPAKGCSMCEVDPVLCEEIGEENLKRSLAFSGTNRRLRRVLAKLRRGETINVGAIGGSVTKGFGLNRYNEPYYPDTPTNLHRIIFDHLVSLYPAPNGVMTGDSGRKEGKHGFINGGQGATGTGYFSYCWEEHVPADLDLIFIEQAINDELLIQNINSYELLVRGLLDLPTSPAIVNLEVFALMFKTITLGGDLHQGIAQFYDLPVLSLRNALLNDMLKNDSLINEYFFIHPEGDVDLRHISRKGHNVLGRIGAAYMDSQICEMDKYEQGIPGADSMSIDQLYPVEPIPRIQINMKYDKDLVLPTVKPQCFSANSDRHPLSPVENNGWRKWNWKEKHYFVADVPGSRISFKLKTHIGKIEIQYLRSYQYHQGSAKCWVDGEVERAIKLDGYWKEPYNIGRAVTIREGLEIGDHTLTCELLKQTADPEGGTEFRLISVMRCVIFCKDKCLYSPTLYNAHSVADFSIC
ncbi:hypothetical protein C343_01038 [Cryptococcus neoformans C23]|uniref:CAP64 gene product-related n=1 Tax=Cryptococcus neoformans Tu259-1 TaxID=1230072 RepID=A0A854QJ77_CRYNE|nr:hypothetical protein C347_01108 [Cryptococcus neoformans var. grubii AD2-60a]OWZ47250.1 hypothetical protein C343_01038 [Cryptococcus neoformans var. grubii C23]OWZ52046.1 hypothetical protein C353_01055 [Cryptococcus neoformans var. grubii AD1-83a]OWZ56832.1 hypothetical protein C368_01544 [Cryptococcus neoformans var. grubii 125.91]OXC86629.1 hypothetical protein C344_01046 [Cryptococcus neoformans var. grubii AD1-7a]OXG27758.1 hypothetical protein C361_01029 [Cryptococcus neoformans var.